MLKHFFDVIVAPAIQEYLDAEQSLTDAVRAGDEGQLAFARVMVLRRARSAAIELHQFADRVADTAPPWAPCGLGALRAWLRDEHSRVVAGLPAEDVDLLHDVADAFKHSALTRARKDRSWLVQNDRAIVSLSTGFGQLGWGEGKYGGVEQVVVEKVDGRMRALSLILKTVEAAWQRAMGRTPEAPYGRT